MRVATIARKPIVGNLAKNILQFRSGAFNINGCRIPRDGDYLDKCTSVEGLDSNRHGSCYMGFREVRESSWSPDGAWPYNLLLVHSRSCQRSEDGWSCVLSCPCIAVAKQSEGALKFFWSGYPEDIVPYLETLIQTPQRDSTGIVCDSELTEEMVQTWKSTLVPGAHVIVLSTDGISEACLLEDNGFEIRDTVLIVDSEGVHNVPKASRRERDAGVPELGHDHHVLRYFPVSDEVDCEVPKDGFELSDVPPDLMDLFEAKEIRIPRRHHNYHATVKPVELMERLISPEDRQVLDPFLGSGTTAVAALRKEVSCLGIEQDESEGYLKIADARIRHHAMATTWIISPVEQTAPQELWDDE